MLNIKKPNFLIIHTNCFIGFIKSRQVLSKEMKHLLLAIRLLLMAPLHPNFVLYLPFSFVPAILDLVCETFLKRNVSAILFLSNTELYGRNTAAAQYFLQLTNYLRIPVVAWNADNSGLEKVSLSFLQPNNKK